MPEGPDAPAARLETASGRFLPHATGRNRPIATASVVSRMTFAKPPSGGLLKYGTWWPIASP